MTETGVLVQNCRLFRAIFGDRQLFVTHMQKDITWYLCDTTFPRTKKNMETFPRTKKNMETFPRTVSVRGKVAIFFNSSVNIYARTRSWSSYYDFPNNWPRTPGNGLPDVQMWIMWMWINPERIQWKTFPFQMQLVLFRRVRQCLHAWLQLRNAGTFPSLLYLAQIEWILI